MGKDYEKMWRELITELEGLVSADVPRSFGGMMMGVVAQTVYGTVLKEMDRIERGYAECDKCGCRMEHVKSTVCDDCAKKMLEGSSFKDLLDL